MNGYTTAVFLVGMLLGVMIIPTVCASQDHEKNSKSIQEALPAQNDREQSLEAKVERRLRLRDDLQWANLAVKVKGSHVTLFGEVATEQDRAVATNLASTIPGVTAITNRIIVNSDLSLPERSTRNGPADREGRNLILEGQRGVKRKEVLP